MTTGKSITQVLIVGAGPTGLTLACDLARRGVGVRILDKAGQYFTGSRGKALSPRTLEVLDDLGVAQRIIDAGMLNQPMRTYDGDRVISEVIVNPEASRPRMPPATPPCMPATERRMARSMISTPATRCGYLTFSVAHIGLC